MNDLPILLLAIVLAIFTIRAILNDVWLRKNAKNRHDKIAKMIQEAQTRK